MQGLKKPVPQADGPLYSKHFGLRVAPFTLTPNTQCFFPGRDRGAMFKALLYASCYTEGVIVLTGEVGTGKTMLARMLVENKPRNLVVAYIVNPRLSPDEIVYAIAAELGVRKLATMRPVEVLRSLQTRLMTLHRQGRGVLVVIDEAHVMTPEALDAIRLLSNLETHHHKLLRIMLVGQDELNRTLASAAMRPLRERITERFYLTGLAARDIALYLAFRLRHAGGPPKLFEAAAIVLLARASAGIMRRVHILADKALLAAFVDGSSSVGVGHVRAAIAEARFSRLSPKRSLRARCGSAWKLTWHSTLWGLVWRPIARLGQLRSADASAVGARPWPHRAQPLPRSG